MKIYIVSQGESGEGSSVESVYQRREDAVAAAQVLSGQNKPSDETAHYIRFEKNSVDYVCVETFELK